MACRLCYLCIYFAHLKSWHKKNRNRNKKKKRNNKTECKTQNVTTRRENNKFEQNVCPSRRQCKLNYVTQANLTPKKWQKKKEKILCEFSGASTNTHTRTLTHSKRNRMPL